MNQGTFSDYHLESGYVEDLVVYAGYSFNNPNGIDRCGLYADINIVSTATNAGNGSRLSWFSTLTTCKITIMLQLLQLCMVWLLSLGAILIRIL